jgi:hypothetical protein
MSKTLFYALPALDSDEGEPLHLTHVSTSFMPVQEAVKSFYTRSWQRYQQNYTAGHYGDPDYEWVLSHHEIYEPADKSLPSIVILRYRLRNSGIDVGELVSATE